MKQNKVKQISFLDCGTGEIIELVGDKDAKMFLVYDILKEKERLVDSFQQNDILYIPPKDDLVENGTVLLATYPENYGEISDLITIIDQFIYKYLDISTFYRKLASYYIVLTWIYDSFETLPYLRPLGDFGTGKTRFQKVVGSLCYKPMFAGGATTPSPVFRIINLYKGTLVIDEGDFRFSDADNELVKIFNCGYTKGIPILRTEGDKERIPTSYTVFWPKIIATRKRFQDTALESRCLTEIMTGNPRKDIPIHLPRDFDKEALKIRNMLLKFRLQNYSQIEVDLTLIIPNVEPRINQIILPILNIIKDDKTRQEIITFITDYANQLKNERGEELPGQILKILKVMIQEGQGLRYKEIAKRINESRDKEQGEYLVSPAKIGRINSSVFNFKTRQVDGVTEILWDKDKGEMLYDRYGIERIDNIDFVDNKNEDNKVMTVNQTQAQF